MQDLLVLCYHSLSERWPAATSVRPRDFEAQLEGLVERGYRGATFSDALTTPTAERTLVVTFDDAHRSVLALAAPVLARLGLPATIFVPTAYAGTDRPMGWDGYDIWLGTKHEDELLCLGWDDLRGLADAGWEIGSHTVSHPHLSRLGENEVLSELTESRQVCEREMGTACTSLAYPYGDYDDRVVRAAAEAGYRFAATAPREPSPSLPLQWPRVGVYHGDDERRVRLRAHARRLRPSSFVGAARALRGLRPRSREGHDPGGVE